mmetsp:Transcript_5139/g.15002  ORF Transcript_5139/g.15002 Transcript_5139/m.15002 type:complete len:211 (+) Transcript_5139:2442-3074(+)
MDDWLGGGAAPGTTCEPSGTRVRSRRRGPRRSVTTATRGDRAQCRCQLAAFCAVPTSTITASRRQGARSAQTSAHEKAVASSEATAERRACASASATAPEGGFADSCSRSARGDRELRSAAAEDWAGSVGRTSPEMPFGSKEARARGLSCASPPRGCASSASTRCAAPTRASTATEMAAGSARMSKRLRPTISPSLYLPLARAYPEVMAS